VKEENLVLHKKASESEDSKKHAGLRDMKEPSYYTYKLVGVVVHNGNADAGHYYSYINAQRDEWEDKETYMNTHKDRWVEFNDSIVREFTFNKLEAECFGGQQEDYGACEMDDIGEYTKLLAGRSKSAYLLVYERRKKFPIPSKVSNIQIQDNDVIVDSLECDSTAISRAEKEHSNVIYKDAKNEFYILHNYHRLPLIVPKGIEAVLLLYNK
jgi:hypothetical protein